MLRSRLISVVTHRLAIASVAATVGVMFLFAARREDLKAQVISCCAEVTLTGLRSDEKYVLSELVAYKKGASTTSWIDNAGAMGRRGQTYRFPTYMNCKCVLFFDDRKAQWSIGYLSSVNAAKATDTQVGGKKVLSIKMIGPSVAQLKLNTALGLCPVVKPVRRSSSSRITERDIKWQYYKGRTLTTSGTIKANCAS